MYTSPGAGGEGELLVRENTKSLNARSGGDSFLGGTKGDCLNGTVLFDLLLLI